MSAGFQKFSIIIPSFNRVDEITALLVSMEELRFPRSQFELIIADDGSTDETLHFIKSYSSASGLNLILVSQSNQGPGAARNLGVAAASGDFFIFIDSDVTVPGHWLEEISKQLQLEGGQAFGGPDTYRDDFPALLKAINHSMNSFLTTGGLRGKKGKSLARYYPRSFNMGLSRALWEKTGGFSKLRHGQDIEFSHRLHQAGAKILFIPKAFVFHKRRTSLKKFFKQVFNWGVARINLYKMNPSMLEPLHALPAVASAGYLLLSLMAFFHPVLKQIWLVFSAFGLLLLLFSSAQALRQYRSIAVALYVPLVIPIQIFGYGIGFIYNFIRRVIFRKNLTTGFLKNYYR